MRTIQTNCVCYSELCSITHTPAASLSPPSPLFLFLSLCASLCSLSIYKSLVLWVATFALSLSCYEFACIIRKEFLAYGAQSFMPAPLSPPPLHPCAPLSALLNLYKCSLSLPLWRCFLLSLDSVLFLLDMLCEGGGVERRGSGIKYCTYRCAGYSPFYYAATLSQLHYVCATLAAPHFAAAAAFATLRIYYKFLHTIYCLSVPPSHGQPCRGRNWVWA